MIMKVIGEDPTRPRSLQPTIDRDLETICLKCLEDRFSPSHPGAPRPDSRGTNFSAEVGLFELRCQNLANLRDVKPRHFGDPFRRQLEFGQLPHQADLLL